MGRQREGHLNGLVRERAPWLESGFWEEVLDEVSLDTMRWDEFALFVAPTDPACEPDPEFAVGLREQLRQLVSRLYAS